ncbi:MAG: AmmeMemoRadiSam system protein B [Armatimonadota bacterium]
MHDSPAGGYAIRQPAVAGQFYPAQPDALRRSIEEAFLSKLGPGEIPTVEAGPRRLLGIVAPHAGYVYSGQGAAWGYAEAARDGRPGAVVILGVNHRGIGAPLALSPAEGWRTPLGVAPVAQDLNRQLQHLFPGVVMHAQAHAHEHSLEVQLPFLQYLFGEVPILPIVIKYSPLESLLALGDALATMAREHDLLFVASTDFSHYVSQETAQRLDHLALEKIAAVDPAGLFNVVLEKDISMCGVLAVTTMLATAHKMGINAVNILQYYTSGDVAGDFQHVVGYGAAALYR